MTRRYPRRPRLRWKVMPGVLGLWDPATPRIVWLNPRQSSVELMDTVIHEVAHWVFPKAPERFIQRLANTASTKLRRLGYRRRP